MNLVLNWVIKSGTVCVLNLVKGLTLKWSS